MRPCTSIRGHVRRLVGRSVGHANVWNAQNGWFWRISSFLSPFMPHHIHFHTFIHSFIHSLIHSFILHSFIHSSKTFIHQFLIKRGALFGLHLALFLIAQYIHKSKHSEEHLCECSRNDRLMKRTRDKLTISVVRLNVAGHGTRKVIIDNECFFK